MDNLIERLHDVASASSNDDGETDALCDAADEIERLTAENMELHADAMEFDDKLTHVARLRLDLESENIRLQAKVEALEGDLNIMRLQRDATHVSRCPKCAATEQEAT